MRLGGHRTTVFRLLCSSDADDADDDCGFFGFLVSVDVGDVDNESVGVPIRSTLCIIMLLIIFGDDVEPGIPLTTIPDGSAIEGVAKILLFNKGHP